jgi:hypothetical protein
MRIDSLGWQESVQGFLRIGWQATGAWRLQHLDASRARSGDNVIMECVTAVAE